MNLHMELFDKGNTWVDFLLTDYFFCMHKDLIQGGLFASKQ